MSTDKDRRWLKPPSPAMIVALIALVFAMSGTALAATQLVSGDSLIKKGTLSGNRLRSQTVTGSKIKASTLGKVPKAASADVADSVAAGVKVPSAAKADVADAVAAGVKVPSAAKADLADAVAAGAVGTSQMGSIPAVRVYEPAGTNGVPNATWRVLSYTAEDFDVGNMHDAVNPSRLTAPVSGKYLVMASCRWQGNTAGRRVMGLAKNGTQSLTQNQVAAYYATPATNSLDPEQTVQVLCQLAAGDWVNCSVYQDSGVSLNLAGQGANLHWFSMVWIAP